TVAQKAYINTSVDVINQRILGRYQNGLGKTWDDPNHMKFFNDGAVNFPYLSDGMWFLTQHKRWGLLKDHPEKVLGTTAEFTKKYPNTTRAVMMAVLEASQWIDASLSNKMKMAETVAQKAYINTNVDVINQRILGRYQNGLGKTWDDPNHMKFYNDGAVNFPYLSDGMWFLTQHKRWGLLKEHPDYLAVAKQVNQIDLYKQVASAMNVPIPKDVLRTSKLMDGVVWDGKDPKKYADGFKIKA
ncbi:MAG: ABC transporter substrate-binding protein, partial [Rhodoferax sp.]